MLMGLAGLAYSLLLYKGAASSQPSGLSAGLALVPVTVVALLLAWGSRYRWALWVLMAAASIVVWWQWGEVLLRHYTWFYLLQHVGIYGALAVFFGRTLVGGRVPLVTRFAAMVHGNQMCPEHIAYARQVTLAWTLFFISMVSVSMVLFLFQPIERWAFFANILGLPLMGLMFGGEYLVRLKRLPHVEHATIIETVRASSRYFREKGQRSQS